MDEQLRQIVRRASSGDTDAEKIIENLRERTGICPYHQHEAIYPAGWGYGCPECEAEIQCIYAGTTRCGRANCHTCNPQFSCEYGHQQCLALETEMLAAHRLDSEELSPEDLLEDEDPDPFWCGRCDGTCYMCQAAWRAHIKEQRDRARADAFDDDYPPGPYDIYEPY